jgi:PIN domain nuclease of toxin-antitoxin system
MIILDTHIWIWFINKNFDKLPANWQDKIEFEDTIAVSSMSCLEVVRLEKHGKISLNCSIDNWLKRALKDSGIQLLEITPEISIRSVNLTSIHQIYPGQKEHKDPCDLIIIATAIEHQAQLASIDSNFPLYPELSNYLLPK